MIAIVLVSCSPEPASATYPWKDVELWGLPTFNVAKDAGVNDAALNTYPDASNLDAGTDQ